MATSAGSSQSVRIMKYGVIPTTLAERFALATGRIPVPLFDAVFSIVKARAVMAGTRLGIFEAMREGSHDAVAVAEQLGLDGDCVELLLRALVLCEYLVQDGQRYRLSKVGRRSLVRGGSRELVGYILWNYTQWKMIESLEDVLRTGKGVDFHRTLEDPEAWRHYQSGMLELARLDGPVLAKCVPVPKGATRLLDVAGSHGLFGATLCRRHPPMRSSVLELPPAVPHARELARAEGIDDVVEHQEGDFMAGDWGSGHDVVLLSNVLHHCSPVQIQTVLTHARSALHERGVVAVWEMERPPRGSKVGHGDGVALFFRLTSSAGAYHGDEYAARLEQSGFRNVRLQRPRMSPGKVLITARAN